MKDKQLEKKIKEQYELYRNTNATSIKEHVVSTLLKEYGYAVGDTLSPDSEVNVFVAKADNSNKIFVQVISPNEHLNYQKQVEFISKLAIENTEWGILTNGQDYILMNKLIKLGDKFSYKGNEESRHEIVFQLNIFAKKDMVYMDYLSKESLFDTKITDYFKHIAEFKALRYAFDSLSWGVYRSTFVSFFNYLVQNKGKYIELNRIVIDDFESYLRDSARNPDREIILTSTINSKFSYMRAFFKTLKIKDSDFYIKKIDFLSRFRDKKDKVYDNNLLNAENIRKILKFYDDNTRESTRNKTILLLCLTYGLERSKIINLTMDQIDNKRILIDGKQLPIPSKLWDYIQELISINLEKGADKYLFNMKYRGEFNHASNAQINYVFDILGEIDRDNLTELSPMYIRKILIKMLFKNNYSIEDIVYLTGIDLLTFTNTISNDEIIQQVKSRENGFKKVHPFADFIGEF